MQGERKSDIRHLVRILGMSDIRRCAFHKIHIMENFFVFRRIFYAAGPFSQRDIGHGTLGRPETVFLGTKLPKNLYVAVIDILTPATNTYLKPCICAKPSIIVTRLWTAKRNSGHMSLKPVYRSRNWRLTVRPQSGGFCGFYLLRASYLVL